MNTTSVRSLNDADNIEYRTQLFNKDNNVTKHHVLKLILRPKNITANRTKLNCMSSHY